MNRIFWKSTVVFFTIILASCVFDNYPEPESLFSGRIVYNNESINVSTGDVSIELWEPGWQKSYPIDVAVKQDGSFSAKLFNARYKLIVPSFQGPFRNLINPETGSDTIIIDLKEDLFLDIEVEPYYLIRNPSYLYSNDEITATFQLDKIITDDELCEIEGVYFYINTTQFVDYRWNVANVEYLESKIDFITMKISVPELMPVQNYVFARIGVKLSGIEDMIFSAVEKVQL